MCIRNDSLAKQNVLRVSRGKALLASYSRNTAISIYPDSSHSSHVWGTCMHHLAGCLVASYPRKLFCLQLLEFSHSLSITQPLQLNPTINTGYKRLKKITIKFGTKLKPTKHIVVNYNFTNCVHLRGNINLKDMRR